MGLMNVAGMLKRTDWFNHQRLATGHKKWD
jgi:hypothetical protein